MTLYILICLIRINGQPKVVILLISIDYINVLKLYPAKLLMCKSVVTGQLYFKVYDEALFQVFIWGYCCVVMLYPCKTDKFHCGYSLLLSVLQQCRIGVGIYLYVSMG